MQSHGCAGQNGAGKVAAAAGLSEAARADQAAHRLVQLLSERRDENHPQGVVPRYIHECVYRYLYM